MRCSTHTRLLILVLPVILALSACSYQHRWAAVDGDTKELSAQLDAGLDVNTRTPVLRTHLLALAAAHGHVETVKLLLDRGADINAADATGWTALHGAAYFGSAEIIQLLLDRGARIPESNWYTPTLLHLAESRGSQSAIDLLQRVEPKPPSAAAQR